MSLLGCWALLALVFATQWYAYDSVRTIRNPFAYYVGWSCYLWAQAPIVLWLSRRVPLRRDSWKRALALHLLASVALTVLMIFLEASFGWMRFAHGISFFGAMRHYYSQHAQISLFTYWFLVSGMEFYRLHDQARRRQLQTARLETRLAQARLDALRAQLQPHFLFNTLNAATTLIYEDPQGAEDVLLRLSDLLRATLQESQSQEICLRKEIVLLDCYMGIQKRRYGERLDFRVDVDESLLEASVPIFVLQPLVENAIRHGIAKHRGDDLVSVQASRHGSGMALVVKNHNSSLADTPDRLMVRGVGLSNTADRLRELYGADQSLCIESMKPSGVMVILQLPARPFVGDPGLENSAVTL
jgi:LytS/YehU family sensor histidine kinase